MTDEERQKHIKTFTMKHLDENYDQIEEDLYEQFRAPWKNTAKKTQLAQTLFKDILKFNDVQVHTNPSKADIIEVLNSLKGQADSVEGTSETLAIGIVWIGHSLGSCNSKQNRVLQELQVKIPSKKAVDMSVLH